MGDKVLAECLCQTESEKQTKEWAVKLAARLEQGIVITLEGELGAGKSTFARAFLQALGVTEKIKSPTYTLVEPYQVGERMLYHLDLYRLASPEECDYLDLREIDNPYSILLIEWASKGAGWLPERDLNCYIDAIAITTRKFCLQAFTARGERLLQAVNQDRAAS